MYAEKNGNNAPLFLRKLDVSGPKGGGVVWELLGGRGGVVAWSSVSSVSMAASPDREEAARLSLLRRVTADEVFNLPLYEHHLVIDLRSAEDFSRGHMTSSVSFPSPSLK